VCSALPFHILSNLVSFAIPNTPRFPSSRGIQPLIGWE
jgi:hypothetical protein